MCCNNLNASRKIAEYLAERGAGAMVYISGNEDTSTSREREQGFAEVLEKRSIAYKKYSSDFSYNGGYETAQNILSEDEIPSAVFAANDIMALGVMDAFRNQGVKIPEQVKVIGFDNIDMASWPAYELTTWEQPIEKMVDETVNYLLGKSANTQARRGLSKWKEALWKGQPHNQWLTFCNN